jgi:hypothetical protein
MSLIFGQDNQFTPAQIPTAVTPFQGVETVPVINVAPKTSALDHFYAFEKNFQRTFDVFSKALDNKGYSILDDLETKRNQDIVDGFSTMDIASRNLQRYAEVAEKGLIPSRTKAHKQFTAGYAKAQGGNVDAIADNALTEFKTFVQDNPYNEGEIQKRYDALLTKYGGSQVWEVLEPETKPIIDAIDTANRKRSLKLAQTQLEGEVKQEFIEKFGLPNSVGYVEKMRELFATTGVTQNEDGSYDFLAAGHAFKTVILDPVLQEMQDNGLLDSQTYKNLESTLGEALVPLVTEAITSVRTYDVSVTAQQRLQTREMALQGAIQNGSNISQPLAALIAEKPVTDDSTGENILWTDNFESTLDEILTFEDFQIPEFEGSSITEIEAARNARITRLTALSSSLPVDIDTFLDEYGSESALAAISPTYSTYKEVTDSLIGSSVPLPSLDEGPIPINEIEIRDKIQREYTAYRNKIIGKIKDKLAVPILKTAESTLEAAYAKYANDPASQKKYFDQNIAPMLNAFFPEEITTINDIFNLDSEGNLVPRKYIARDNDGNPVDIDINIWQGQTVDGSPLPTVNDWQAEERDGTFFVYAGINNDTGERLTLDSSLAQDIKVFRYNSEEEAASAIGGLIKREAEFLSEQLQQTSLQGEPNRTFLNLEAVNEIPVLNDREQSILALLTKHDSNQNTAIRRLLGGSTGGASAYRDMLTGVKDPTPGMISKDDQRTAVQNGAFWFSGMRRGDPQLTENWWNGLIRDARNQGSRIDIQQFEQLKTQYLKIEQEITNMKGIDEQERQKQLNANKQNFKARIDAHVYGSSFVLEYREASNAEKAGGHGNAVDRLLKPEAQQSRLKSDLTQLLREEGGRKPEKFFDGNGNPNNDARFESDKALTFIRQAMYSMNIAGISEEDQYAFFGEFEPAVRLSLEHAAHLGTSVIKNQDGHLHIELNSQYKTGISYVQAMPGLSSTLDTISDLIFTSPDQIEAFIISAEATDMTNIVRPSFMAALNFLVNPSDASSQQNYSASKRAVQAVRGGNVNLSDEFNLGFTAGMRKELENRGIDPEIYGSLLREDNIANQFFKAEFRLQLNAKIGEQVEKLEQIQGSELRDDQMQDAMFSIIKDAYSATIDATFGVNSPFNFIRGDGEQSITVRKLGGFSATGMLQPNQSDEEFSHIRKTFDLLETRYQKDVTGGLKQSGENTPKYAPYVVDSDLRVLSNEMRGEDLAQLNTREEAVSVLADGLSLFMPTSNATQVRANEIILDIGATLSETPSLISALKIPGGFDIEQHKAELQQQRQEKISSIKTDGEFVGATDEEINAAIAKVSEDDTGVSSEVIRAISNMNIMHLIYFNQRSAEGYEPDEVLMIGSMMDEDSYRFRFRENNNRESLTLMVPNYSSYSLGNPTQSSTQIRYDFYMPREKGSGNYIPVNSYIPKQESGRSASERYAPIGM